MLSTPIVSVLMPVYRTEPRYVRQAVESVLAQDFDAWELVVVEDPSDRMAQGVINDYQDSRIRYYPNAQRTSLIAQRNKTIKLSRGEFLAMLDSDDISDPQRLSKQLAYLEQHPDLGVLGSQLAIIDDQGIEIAQRRYP